METFAEFIKQLKDLGVMDKEPIRLKYVDPDFNDRELEISSVETFVDGTVTIHLVQRGTIFRPHRTKPHDAGHELGILKADQQATRKPQPSSPSISPTSSRP